MSNVKRTHCTTTYEWRSEPRSPRAQNQSPTATMTLDSHLSTSRWLHIGRPFLDCYTDIQIDPGNPPKLSRHQRCCLPVQPRVRTGCPAVPLKHCTDRTRSRCAPGGKPHRPITLVRAGDAVRLPAPPGRSRQGVKPPGHAPPPQPGFRLMMPLRASPSALSPRTSSIDNSFRDTASAHEAGRHAADGFCVPAVTQRGDDRNATPSRLTDACS